MISPLLLNVALHGLEAGRRSPLPNHPAARPGTRSRAPRCWSDTPTIWSRCCHTQEQAEQVKARLAEWLAPRGLVFNEDKTQIVHLSEGFDFLGFNVRRYGPASC